MYWITADPAIIIVILITAGAIDINMLMVPAVGATDRLSGKFHKHSYYPFVINERLSKSS
ncbi:pteridine reductase [Shewanella benthica KT99]|uniref:Pteridine reductase n=1 Tax=Shewanella benthica KT99 TaxID=314608 RepID=A9DMN8_9GAMM|nr:pteridine reductase [Shewanella benthica KT99]